VIRISGGWVDGFSRRTDDPGLETVLDGAAGGTVLTVFAEGEVSFTGFAIQGGGAGRSTAGGVFLSAGGSASLQFFENTIRENRVTAAGPVSGGGLVGEASGGGRLSIRDNLFARNAAISTAGVATDGGAAIGARDESVVEVVRNRFVDNEVRSPVLAMASALSVGVEGSAQAEVEGNVLGGNRAAGGPGGGFTALRLRSSAGAGTASRLFARRNQVIANPTDPPGQQVEMHALGKGAVLVLGDSVIARGSGRAISALATDGGSLSLVNLTVTGHPGGGVGAHGEPIHVTNTILFDNGSALEGPAIESHNLTGVDPMFVNPEAHDFRLSFRSPAVDAGDNTAPFLGTLDVYGDGRISNGVVDVGAAETSTPCRVLSSSPFVDRSAPACTCLSDPGLRQTRCGFFVPDFFLVMIAPFPLPPDPAPVTWTIHPWMPIAGPYEMRAEAYLDGQWVPQTWLGPSARRLKDGKDVAERFSVQAGKDRTPLRTTLEYRRRGAQGPSSVTMEILLPEPRTK
jgi:hypothetical protein